MRTRGFPIPLLVVLGMLLTTGPARAQFRGVPGGLMPVPTVVVPAPFGAPFRIPLYSPAVLPPPPAYSYGAYPLLRGQGPSLPAMDIQRLLRSTPMQGTGGARRKIQEFDPPGRAMPAVEGTAARVEVRVPKGAEVWFDRKKSNAAGAVRHFESPPLPEGQAYNYEVRARWKDRFGYMDDFRTVTLRAGDQVTVDFVPRQGTVLEK